MVFFIGLFFFAGCTRTNSTDTVTSSTTEVSQTTTVDETTETVITGTTTEATTETTTETTTTETSRSSDQTEAISALQEVQEKYPKIALPSEIPHSEKVVNVASAGTDEELSVLYFDMETPLILNKKELNYEIPIAQYQTKRYKTKDEALLAVNLRVDNYGQRVDLGHGITGYQQGAAGSSYISWEEGNWNLLVRGSNILQQDPVPTAKQVVEYLEKEFLPAPEELGQITIDMNGTDYKRNEVVWQVGNQVYTIHHQDPVAALVMAVSTEK